MSGVSVLFVLENTRLFCHVSNDQSCVTMSSVTRHRTRDHVTVLATSPPVAHNVAAALYVSAVPNNGQQLDTCVSP